MTVTRTTIDLHAAPRKFSKSAAGAEMAVSRTTIGLQSKRLRLGIWNKTDKYIQTVTNLNNSVTSVTIIQLLVTVRPITLFGHP